MKKESPVDFPTHFLTETTKAFKILLSEKHLYQSVNVDTSYIEKTAEEINSYAHYKAASNTISGNRPPITSKENYQKEGEKAFENAWEVGNPETNKSLEWHDPERATEKIQLPTIQTICPHCKERWPFNLVKNPKCETSETKHEQWFLLAYQCQACKKEPIRFLVKRSRKKLTLCGREPIETAPIPPCIPKPQANYYRKATIAAQSGEPIAANALLRTFVEQYWWSIKFVQESVKEIRRPTGDELGEAYKKILPEKLKGEFPTLCEVYSDLSAALHCANESPDIHTSACEKIIMHFDAIKLFEVSV